MPPEIEQIGTDPFSIIYQDDESTLSAMQTGPGVVLKSRTCECVEGIVMNVSESMTFVPGAKLKNTPLEVEDGEWRDNFTIE